MDGADINTLGVIVVVREKVCDFRTYGRLSKDFGSASTTNLMGYMLIFTRSILTKNFSMHCIPEPSPGKIGLPRPSCVQYLDGAE